MRLPSRAAGTSWLLFSPGEREVVKDASKIAVVRFTIQPSACFPWRSHPGTVMVTVTQDAVATELDAKCKVAAAMAHNH